MGSTTTASKGTDRYMFVDPGKIGIYALTKAMEKVMAKSSYLMVSYTNIMSNLNRILSQAVQGAGQAGLSQAAMMKWSSYANTAMMGFGMMSSATLVDAEAENPTTKLEKMHAWLAQKGAKFGMYGSMFAGSTGAYFSEQKGFYAMMAEKYKTIGTAAKKQIDFGSNDYDISTKTMQNIAKAVKQIIESVNNSESNQLYFYNNR